MNSPTAVSFASPLGLAKETIGGSASTRRPPMCVAGPARPRAVVVGAGPVGALAALHLERGGYAVTVFEQRPAAVREGRRSRPAYSIVLNERGLAAMSPFPGLREGVAKRAVPITGTCAHLAAGKVRVKLGGPFAGSLSIARDDLVSTLVDYGRAHNISYRLDTAVADVDFDARSLRASGVCVDADGDAGTAQRFESVGYELCVLAEGVYAGRYGGLRDRAVKRGLLACTGVPDSMVFKIAELGRVDGFFDPPAASSDANDPGLFRTFPSNQPLCSVLAPPRRDGQVHAVLVMPAAGGFDKYFLDEASIARSFERFFPFVFGPAGPPPSVVASLKAQPASTGGVTTCCSRYDVGEACVIIGDSAHSCWPSLGQSCNAGLESVSVLGAALFSSADGGPPVNGALAERLCLYSAVRKPDADAVGQLSERGFGKNSRVLTKRALLRIATMVLLSKLFPGTPFLVPALFDLDKPSVAYAAILRKQQRQDAFVDMCVLAVTILAAAVGLASFS